MKSYPPLITQTLDALRSVVGDNKVSLHEPSFKGNEWDYVKDCLESSFVSSVGMFVDRLEFLLADFTGSKHAVAVNNGTAALHIALKVCGVVPGDEVLVPALTFIATANAIAYCNATPHFVESDESNFGINAQALRSYLETQTVMRNGYCFNKATGRILRAMIPMHTFGHPCNMDDLLSVANDFNIIIIEDAAESLGSSYRGQHTGTFGRAAAISFNGNKIITAGGGGAIITSDSTIAARAKHLTTTAKLSHPWRYLHDEIGYNYRMPNLNAALGCAQMEQIHGFIKVKRRLFKRYEKAFKNVEGVILKKEPAGCRSNYWLQTIVLDEHTAKYHEELLRALNEAGYASRPAWNLLHQLKPYKDSPRMKLPIAESLASRIINIPSSASIVQDMV